MLCQHSENMQSKTQFVIKCCQGYDYCNKDLAPTLAPPTTAIGNNNFFVTVKPRLSNIQVWK